MVYPKILRLENIESHPLVDAEKNVGWLKRIIYPPNVITKRIWLEIAEVIPGHSPHRWHIHTIEKDEGYEMIYPQDFEEICYVVSGSGIIQSKTEGGKIKEEKVSAGDTIFFPVGVGEHQLFNNGTEKMSLVYCGSPKYEIKYTK